MRVFAVIRSLALVLAMTGAARAAGSASEADKTFVAKVSQGGMFEVNASKVAEYKASAQDVRDQATTEVHDHGLVGAKLKAVAGHVGLTFPSRLNADFTARIDVLKALSGPAFDTAYLKEMETIHDADGAAFAEEARMGGDPGLCAFAAETHVIVERHIGALKAIPLPAQ